MNPVHQMYAVLSVLAAVGLAWVIWFRRRHHHHRS